MKTIKISNQEVTVAGLVEKIQSLLTLVSNGYPSQYLNVSIEDEDNYDSFKIRVSDHSANRLNNSDNEKTLSFVTDTCDQTYKMGYNEYLVDDIEDMNTNECTYKGYLSVEEIIEDFVEDFKF